MNPLRVWMPYIKPVSASSICFVRYRKRGSGLTLNGLSFSLKQLLYIAVGCLGPFLPLSSFSSPPLSLFRGAYCKANGFVCHWKFMVTIFCVKLVLHPGVVQTVGSVC